MVRLTDWAWCTREVYDKVEYVLYPGARIYFLKLCGWVCSLPQQVLTKRVFEFLTLAASTRFKNFVRYAVFTPKSSPNSCPRFPDNADVILTPGVGAPAIQVFAYIPRDTPALIKGGQTSFGTSQTRWMAEPRDWSSYDFDFDSSPWRMHEALIAGPLDVGFNSTSEQCQCLRKVVAQIYIFNRSYYDSKKIPSR